MIAANNISIQFSGEALFSDITFNLGDKDRVGLVGKNGAGKSTLLKVLAGLQEPTTGTLVMASGQTVGYLPQEMIPDSHRTVLDETLTAFTAIDKLEHELQLLNDKAATRTDYDSTEYQRLITRIADITEQVALLGGHRREEAASTILAGLGFHQQDLDRPLTVFSGGWQMRVELAKLLLQRPDFLLLDEPTNHLDLPAIEWLEGFLLSYPGAVVLVSHDRTFLDNITLRTIEITAGRIYDYKVPYSQYVVLMQERRASQMAQLTAQQRQIAQIEAFIERFRYKATKSRQVQSRIKMLDRMELVQVDEVSTESIHFAFPPAPPSGKTAVELQHLSKSFGTHTVLSDINLVIPAGSRSAFIGRNGEGKSTLARILVGDLADYEGTYRPGHNISIGYYAQNQAALLDPTKTVFETIDDIATGDIRTRLRSILASFLFTGDDLEKKVRVLSGGEKARLALAKLLLSPSNLLILDEPTNHLDIDSKDILKNALLQYTGTLIIVSHDRDFLQGLTDTLYEFRDGAIHEHRCDIMDFLDEQKLANKPTQTAAAVADEAPKQSQISRQQSKERERTLRKLKNAVEEAEKEIESLEEKVAAMDSRLATSPDTLQPDFYSEYDNLKKSLDQCMQRWEQASIDLEQFLQTASA
ncbi:MAG: ABC-F family ATP-binding cassette domain-containing protein [Bacteroidales bacterium]|nr:ABC-F family ATP-binding cassette domain-containing protein [Bacteroidales bacterium]